MNSVKKRSLRSQREAAPHCVSLSRREQSSKSLIKSNPNNIHPAVKTETKFWLSGEREIPAKKLLKFFVFHFFYVFLYPHKSDSKEWNEKRNLSQFLHYQTFQKSKLQFNIWWNVGESSGDQNSLSSLHPSSIILSFNHLTLVRFWFFFLSSLWKCVLIII